jgi:hypothetical protein
MENAMKSFKEYLVESKKTYAFKVKVAGDLVEDFDSKLKMAMEKFSVIKVSSGKRTPIRDVPLDFPDMKNTSVTVYDVEVNYPTTPDVLENYISQFSSMPLHCVKVRTGNEPSEQYQEAMKKEPENDEALLDQVDLGGDSAQDMVGEKRVSSFLKDLANEAKSRSNEGQPKEQANNMPEPGASVSPVGSKAQKGK